MHYDIIKESRFGRKSVFLVLLSIGIIGLLVRLYFEPQTPLTADATNYFVYAADTSLTGKLSENYYLTNNGWPMFLSVLFSSTKLDDPFFLMELQRFSSMIISAVTIIPVYFLCRRFFNPEYSLIGSSLFAFQPHIIINSSLGVTEPIFVFLGISSLVLFLNNNHKIIYLSFAIAGLFTLVRYEGLLFFVMLSIMFFVRYRSERKHFVRYSLVLAIYVLVLLPVAYYNFETYDRDGFVSELFDKGETSYQHFVEGKPDVGDPLYGDASSANMQNFLTIGMKNTIWFFGLASIPIFIFIVPMGVILIIKNRKNLKIDFQIVTIVLVSLTMLIPAFFSYAKGSEDVRYLFMIFPLLVLISLYALNKWKIKKYNLIIVGIITVIILTSFFYLELKKVDYDHDSEVFLITKFIVSKTGVINGDSADVKYRRAAEIIVNWPNLPPPISIDDSHLKRGLIRISTSGEKSLLEFIDSSKDKGLTHLAVDGREYQPEFLKDVFYYDERYPYLKMIYDSSELGIKYHVKIYEIDFVRMYEN